MLLLLLLFVVYIVSMRLGETVMYKISSVPQFGCFLKFSHQVICFCFDVRLIAQCRDLQLIKVNFYNSMQMK